MIYRRVAVALLTLSAACGVAHAQSPEDIDQARELAGQASDLLDEQRFEEALERVTQAEAKFHAPTHLLMMAEAQIGLGRLVDAVDTYERIAAEPLPSSAPRAFVKAKETARVKLRDLIARIPSLKIVVRGPDSGGVSVTVDDKPFPLDADEAVRFDPGERRLKVVAQGYVSVERSVILPNRGGVTVEEVLLVKESEVEAAPVQPPPARPPDVAVREEPSLVPVWVAFGVGGAGLVVGTVSGVLALKQVGRLSDRCPDYKCPEKQQERIDSARTLGTVSTIGFGVAVVGAGTGLGLLLLGQQPSDPAAESRSSVQPWIGLGSAGLEGRF
jgi:hypothetical protein